jgi:hypothetical protein
MLFKAIVCVVLLVTSHPWAKAQPMADFLWGSATPVSSTNRTIVIDADTRWVNVRDDEVVNFDIVGHGRFAWRFDGPGWRAFDLRQVAPGGALSRPVTVYVTRGLQW